MPLVCLSCREKPRYQPAFSSSIWTTSPNWRVRKGQDLSGLQEQTTRRCVGGERGGRGEGEDGWCKGGGMGERGRDRRGIRIYEMREGGKNERDKYFLVCQSLQLVCQCVQPLPFWAVGLPRHQIKPQQPWQPAAARQPGQLQHTVQKPPVDVAIGKVRQSMPTEGRWRAAKYGAFSKGMNVFKRPTQSLQRRFLSIECEHVSLHRSLIQTQACARYKACLAGLPPRHMIEKQVFVHGRIQTTLQASRPIAHTYRTPPTKRAETTRQSAQHLPTPYLAVFVGRHRPFPSTPGIVRSWLKCSVEIDAYLALQTSRLSINQRGSPPCCEGGALLELASANLKGEGVPDPPTCWHKIEEGMVVMPIAHMWLALQGGGLWPGDSCFVVFQCMSYKHWYYTLLCGTVGYNIFFYGVTQLFCPFVSVKIYAFLYLHSTRAVGLTVSFLR